MKEREAECKGLRVALHQGNVKCFVALLQHVLSKQVSGALNAMQSRGFILKKDIKKTGKTEKSK